jgi:hypothetical protein
MTSRLLTILVGILLLATTACGAAGETLPQVQGQPVVAASPTLTTQVGPTIPSMAASPAPTTQVEPTALPTAGGSSRPLDCDLTISTTFVRLDNVTTLAWVSHQVVVGTVTEELPPVWIYPEPQNRPLSRQIYTDYLVRIDQQLRGLPETTVRVRYQGGKLDGCTQQNADVPPLVVGDRLLFFLREFAIPSAQPPAYSAIGGPQGYWGLNADGTVATSIPHYQQFNRMPLTQVVEEVRAALLGTPPKTVPQNLLVPLDRAPLPAVP